MRCTSPIVASRGANTSAPTRATSMNKKVTAPRTETMRSRRAAPESIGYSSTTKSNVMNATARNITSYTTSNQGHSPALPSP